VSLQTVCAELAEVIARPESGIVAAFNQPPEVLGSFPAAWVNPVSGTVARQSGDAMWLHRIELVVYVTPRVTNLPAEFARIAPLVSSVERAVWDAYESGDAFGQGVSRAVVASYQIGLRDFGGKPYHSITFVVDVKEHTA